MNLLKNIIYPIHFLFPYSLTVSLSRKLKRIYSLWVGFSFPKIGRNVTFGRIGDLRGFEYISIGDFTSFGDWLYLTAWNNYKGQEFNPKIQIGSDCSFGAFNHITSINSITIGNGVLTGKWVTITDNSHGKTDYISLTKRPNLRFLFSKGAVEIGNNVWIGDKVTILPGVTIGDGAVIGANSVITEA